MEQKELEKNKKTEESKEYCEKIRKTKKIAKKKIVFSQFGGNGYGCNPKAICDEILRRGHKWDLVWLLKKGSDISKAGLPEGIRPCVANDGARNSLYELETAKVWINNIHFQALIGKGLVKRPETTYINTFHGGICIKREGTDRPNYAKKMSNMSEKVKNQMKDCEMVDFVTSGSDIADHTAMEFFHNHGQLLRTGDARNDIIIKGSKEIEEKVRKFYKLSSDTKIMLYAPTFRDNADLTCFDIDYEGILDALEQRDGCKWIAFAKMHPNLRKKAKELIPKSDRVKDVSAYIDMQELLVASDLMITDYSSGIADFMLSRKPGFMYAKDLEQYLSTRGLYFELDEMPFPVARNSEEMIEKIKNFDKEKYEADVQKFIDSIGYLDDGKASERIVDFLETIIEPWRHIGKRKKIKALYVSK